MNIDRMINMLLIKLSQNHKIFYMEKRNYKDTKIYKSYLIKIDDITKEYNSKTDLLFYLKEMI